MDAMAQQRRLGRLIEKPQRTKGDKAASAPEKHSPLAKDHESGKGNIDKILVICRYMYREKSKMIIKHDTRPPERKFGEAFSKTATF